MFECSNVVHLSDGVGDLPIIERAKEEIRKSNGSRRRLTAETCPHYLLLVTSQIENGDVRVKCFQPIREKEQRKQLWQGISSGLIDMIASDHSPCEPSMRKHSVCSISCMLVGQQ